MQTRSPYLVPALAGGALMAIPTAIPGVGMCCCLWALGGGGLAAYLAAPRIPRFGAREGLVAGLGAGAIATALYAFLAVALQALLLLVRGPAAPPGVTIPADTPPALADVLRWLHDLGPAVTIALNVSVALLVFLALGAVGGILGGLLVQRRAVEDSAAQVEREEDEAEDRA